MLNQPGSTPVLSRPGSSRVLPPGHALQVPNVATSSFLAPAVTPPAAPCGVFKSASASWDGSLRVLPNGQSRPTPSPGFAATTGGGSLASSTAPAASQGPLVAPPRGSGTSVSSPLQLLFGAGRTGTLTPPSTFAVSRPSFGQANGALSSSSGPSLSASRPASAVSSSAPAGDAAAEVVASPMVSAQQYGGAGASPAVVMSRLPASTPRLGIEEDDLVGTVKAQNGNDCVHSSISAASEAGRGREALQRLQDEMQQLKTVLLEMEQRAAASRQRLFEARTKVVEKFFSRDDQLVLQAVVSAWRRLMEQERSNREAEGYAQQEAQEAMNYERRIAQLEAEAEKYRAAVQRTRDETNAKVQELRMERGMMLRRADRLGALVAQMGEAAGRVGEWAEAAKSSSSNSNGVGSNSTAKVGPSLEAFASTANGVSAKAQRDADVVQLAKTAMIQMLREMDHSFSAGGGSAAGSPAGAVVQNVTPPRSPIRVVPPGQSSPGQASPAKTGFPAFASANRYSSNTTRSTLGSPMPKTVATRGELAMMLRRPGGSPWSQAPVRSSRMSASPVLSAARARTPPPASGAFTPTRSPHRLHSRPVSPVHSASALTVVSSPSSQGVSFVAPPPPQQLRQPQGSSCAGVPATPAASTADRAASVPSAGNTAAGSLTVAPASRAMLGTTPVALSSGGVPVVRGGSVKAAPVAPSGAIGSHVAKAPVATPPAPSLGPSFVAGGGSFAAAGFVVNPTTNGCGPPAACAAGGSYVGRSASPALSFIANQAPTANRLQLVISPPAAGLGNHHRSKRLGAVWAVQGVAKNTRLRDPSPYTIMQKRP